MVTMNDQRLAQAWRRFKELGRRVPENADDVRDHIAAVEDLLEQWDRVFGRVH